MDLKALSELEVCLNTFRMYETVMFLSIHSNEKPIMFYKNATNLKSEFCIDYHYYKINIGTYLIEFLNLDFTKYNDFFKFFCTFIVEYINDIPEKDLKKILSDLNIYEKYFDMKEPKHISDIETIKKYAKKFFEDGSEIAFLTEMQQLFKTSVDYIFNNNKEDKLEKLNTYQRFYILQNINKDFEELSKKYMCDFKLKFRISNHEHINDVLTEIINGKEDPLSNEDELIRIILKNDSEGKYCSSNRLYIQNI